MAFLFASLVEGVANDDTQKKPPGLTTKPPPTRQVVPFQCVSLIRFTIKNRIRMRLVLVLLTLRYVRLFAIRFYFYFFANDLPQ